MPSHTLQDSDLELAVELLETRLNEAGKYYLRISLVSQEGRDKLGNVTVTVVGSGGKPETKPTIVTDMILLTKQNKDAGVKFKKNKFLFTLPKGLCVNDSKQTLSFVIAVYKIGPPSGKGLKLSAGVFEVFPRDAPPIPNLDDPDELYFHEEVMTFSKTLKEEGTQKQIGKVRFEIALRWAEESDEKPKEKLEEKPKEVEKKSDEDTPKNEPADKHKEKEEDKHKDKEEEKHNDEKPQEEQKAKEEEKEESKPKEKDKIEKEEKPKEKEEEEEEKQKEVEKEKKAEKQDKVKESTPEPTKPTGEEKPKSPSPPPTPPPPQSPTNKPKDPTPPPPSPKQPPPSPPSPPLSAPPVLPSGEPSPPLVENDPEKILANFQAHGIETKLYAPPTPVKSKTPPIEIKPDTPVLKLHLPLVEIKHHRRRDIESPRLLSRYYEQISFRDNTVAKAGHVEVVIIVHAASQIPKLPDGSIPKPYVIGRGKGRYKARNHIDQRVTHPSVRPSLSPSWEELIVVEIKTKDTKKEAVHLLLADQYSKSVLLEYELDLAFLKPFHQYHLDLVQSVEPDHLGMVQASHLFVSVILKSSQLPVIGAFEFQALEVMLVAMEESLSNPIGPLTAVARVVPDFFNYVQSISHHKESSALNSLSVQCPTPHPSSFLSTQTQFGHPQWTLPGLPEQQPIWNHTFLFCDPSELASMFTDTAALVIEFYPTSTTFNGSNWSLPQCCGYGSLLLDMRLHEALMSDRGSMGVRVDHIILQLTKLNNRYNQAPSVGLVLRLPTTVEPDTMVSVADIDALPTLDAFLRPDFPIHDSPLFTRLDLSAIMTPPPKQQYNQTTKRTSNMSDAVVPFRRKAVNEEESPSYSALENILKLAKQPSPGNSSHGSSSSGLIPTRLPPKGLQNGHHSSTPPSSTSSDKYALSLLDSQQKEIDSYKEALKRMGEDIVRLQEEVSRLEMENSQLRKRIDMHEDATKAMVNVKELDDMSRADLIDKYVTLTRKLSSQIDETSEYREKLVRMQNNMIKQNDREQQYLKQRDDFLTQQDELQHRHEKVKKLERTCMEQEKALEKMERILRNKLKNNKSEEHYKADEISTLAAENGRLRAQVEQTRKTPPGKGSSEDAEKLRLQLHLEKAKGRVASLEREFIEKAREWGKEKEVKQLRLLEKAREWGKEKEVMRLRVGEQRNSHRSLPPLPRERGYNNYNMSDDDMDDYPSPKYQRHKRLSPLY